MSDEPLTSKKRLAFEAAQAAVSYLLRRSDLLDWERTHIQRVTADMAQLLYPLARPAVETSERWPCPYCRSEFPTREAFREHIKCMRDELNGTDGR